MLFVVLLRHVCYDDTVLLDWLLTDETPFLEYLLRCVESKQPWMGSISLSCVT
jgi:hypothetical protein